MFRKRSSPVLLALALAVVAGTGLLAPAVLAADDLLERLGRQKPSQLVNDYAGVFSSGQKASLEALLEELDRKTGAQLAVVAVPSLEGGQIEDFANRLFGKWGIGQKGKDNGILLIASLQDRKVRIEVGYGLEGLLPDARSGRIIDAYVLPQFRQARYADGLTDGARALAEIIAGDAKVQVTGAVAPRPAAGSGSAPFPPALIVFIIIAIIIMSQRRRGFHGGGFYGGGFSGGGGGFSGGFGGFGGGMSGGGGASRGW